MKPFDRYVRDLLARPEVRRLARRERHHFSQDRLAHCLATAKFSYQAARLLGADVRICTRAALLHDWYFETRPDHLNRVGANVHHYRIAGRNARGLGESAVVVRAIETHMWPYGRRRPQSLEAWIVWMADNVVWVYDLMVSGYRYALKKVWMFIYGRPVRYEAGYAA